MSQLTPIPNITKLSSRVIRILGLNPSSFTLQGTNTYLLGTGRQRLLIDTGDGRNDHLELIDEVLNTEQATLSKIFLTHWHPDHTGGLLPLLKKHPQSSIQVFKKVDQHLDEDYIQYISDIDFTNGNAKPISVEGATLIPITTPGHTPDHLALYLVEDGTLFSGDCILGEGTTTFEDLGAYMRSLQVLLNFFPPIKSIYPGHGPVITDGKKKIQEYIDHRLERENQILAILHLDPPPPVIVNPKRVEGRPAYSSSDLVTIIYVGYPENVLDKARHVITLQLKKLQDEKKVRSFSLAEDNVLDHIYWQYTS